MYKHRKHCKVFQYRHYVNYKNDHGKKMVWLKAYVLEVMWENTALASIENYINALLDFLHFCRQEFNILVGNYNIQLFITFTTPLLGLISCIYL